MRDTLFTQFEHLGDAQDYAADIHEIFGSVPLFEPLALEETTLLCHFMAVYSAHTGAVLMPQGSAPQHMVILLTGKAQVVQTLANGGSVIRYALEPGGTFGELAMLDGQALHASCVSSEPVDFVVISRQAFRDLMLTLPRLANKLLLLFLHEAALRLRTIQPT